MWTCLVRVVESSVPTVGCTCMWPPSISLSCHVTSLSRHVIPSRFWPVWCTEHAGQSCQKTSALCLLKKKRQERTNFSGTMCVAATQIPRSPVLHPCAKGCSQHLTSSIFRRCRWGGRVTQKINVHDDVISVRPNLHAKENNQRLNDSTLS